MDCRKSKTGRGSNARSETATKKKAKVAAVKAEEAAAKVEEEEEEDGGEGLFVVEKETAAELEEFRMHSWSGVDEGMPWATCWFPFWEMEAALYGDVWDYDIWGIKGGDNNAPK